MTEGECVQQAWSICFEFASRSEGDSFFGFSEFLATTAIFVAAYTISDERYKLRIENSRINFRLIFISLIIFSGLILCLSEFWFAARLPIPSSMNNIIYFHVVVSFFVLIFICYWIFVAFIRPPKFSAPNAQKFAENIVPRIAYGNEQAHVSVALELISSVESIFQIAHKQVNIRDLERGGVASVLTEDAKVARQVIALLGDPRFCKSVARHVPNFASQLFFEASKFNIIYMNFEYFSRNVSEAFFRDINTAIHYESDGLNSGLIGYTRPISKELFGHVELVEQLASTGGSPLDPSWRQTDAWCKRSWETFIKCALAFLGASFEKTPEPQCSLAARQICACVRRMCMSSDALLIDAMGEDSWQSLPFRKIELASSFVGDVLDLLEENGVFGPIKSAGNELRDKHDIYDELVDVSLELFRQVSAVRTAEFRNWQLQHNTVWSEIIGVYKESNSRKIFRGRFLREIYKEIRLMEEFPNFKGARLLSVCLNVMGLQVQASSPGYKKYSAFHRWLLRWVVKNYWNLTKEVPDVAKCCLSGRISYNEEAATFVQASRSSFGRKPKSKYLKVQKYPINQSAS